MLALARSTSPSSGRIRRRALTAFALAAISLVAIRGSASGELSQATPAPKQVPYFDPSVNRRVSEVASVIGEEGFLVSVVEEQLYTPNQNMPVLRVEPQPTTAADECKLTPGEFMHVYVAGTNLQRAAAETEGPWRCIALVELVLLIVLASLCWNLRTKSRAA
jgi:hypothetical protein